jgi:hypothetical protein
MSHSHLSHHRFNRSYSAGGGARFLSGFGTLLALAALAAFMAPHAAAISSEEELTRFAGPGSGAGGLTSPGGIGADPITGHVFVAESGANGRISEFTPWGNFVKAFGWDVAPGAVNEQQELRVRGATGQFKLTFGTFTTADLAFNAPGSASEGPGSVEAALNALPSIGGAGGEVSVETAPGTPDGKAPYIYVVAFKGSLAGTNVGQLTIANGTTPVSGGVPSTSLEARTRADGHAATSGLEACTTESGCKAGLTGPGAGQFGNQTGARRGVVVDAATNLYVREATNSGNGRVQKFDSAGRFLLMFGGEVNKTAVGLREEQEANAEPVTVSEAEENLCTASSGDECGIGTAGNGKGQFGASGSGGIALGSGDKLFVGDVERIQRFNLEGEYEAEVPVSVPVFEGGITTVHDLAIDPLSGDIYAVVGRPSGTDQNVRILDATSGEEIGQLEAFELKNSKGLSIPATTATAGPIATDAAGSVFVRRNNLSLENPGDPLADSLLQFDSEGNQTSEFGAGEFGIEIQSSATNALGGLYVAYVSTSSTDTFIRALGPPPVSFEGAPPVPPEIVAQFASSVDRTSAVLGAEINPKFWTNTRYYVQYGTGKCSEGGCEEEEPLPPGPFLTSKVTDDPVKSAGIAIDGLKPGTTYHYRFVTESSGGGPVRGVGGEVGVDGEESSFATYPVPSQPKTNCPNQGFRIGFSAPLPDCRAYEMVSPVDKNNGDIRALLNDGAYPTALTQSATDGSRFTYSSYRAFADPDGAPHTNQYLATREDGVGWSSKALASAQPNMTVFENQYKAFTADLCLGWVVVPAEPVLAPGVPPGYLWPYRRDNCGGGSYEPLIDDVEPALEGKGKGSFFPVLQGTSADGAEAVFVAENKLTEEATGGVWQAYYVSDASKGEPHLLCIGPKGLPSGGSCSAGTLRAPPSRPYMERESSLTHAISSDGSKVYWTDSTNEPTEAGPGKIYLRENPGLPESAGKDGGGNCIPEPEAACTVKVSETKTGERSQFRGASADGTKALFEVTKGALKGDLYKFDSESASSVKIAGKTLGVTAASEDLSRVYFVSEEAIASGAVAGKPNLYLDEEGTVTFIGALSKTDEKSLQLPNNIYPESVFHAARATPDGRVLAFISSASPTGYDNNDLASGKANSEVYIYEAGTTAPVCVSCNPSGARPGGRFIALTHFTGGLQTAAWLPLPDNSLDSPRFFSEDGRRLFFNSFDALLPRDTNGKGDVYEWQAASGQKACDEKGAELYVPSSGGCISLISSGQSPQDSDLLDVSANGDDAFFTTNASLLPQDPGLIDVYDARAGGGLPAPPEPPGPCQGEACQFAPPPPNDPTPASASFKGAGNLRPKPRGRCAKGKARRKGRCVAKRKRANRHQHKRDANPNRRASR